MRPLDVRQAQTMKIKMLNVCHQISPAHKECPELPASQSRRLSVRVSTWITNVGSATSP